MSKAGKRAGRAITVSGLCLLLLLGCGEPPNLLLVSIDTLRSDHTSVHGYARDTTPRLAQLGAEGVRFDLAYSATASTAPSHASLFTGSHPIHHGLVKNGLTLDEDRLTLAEMLREEGYTTAGVAGSFVLDPRFGFAQGFEHFDADFKDGSLRPQFEWEGHIVPVFDRRGRETTQKAIHWLTKQRDRSRPFFLFVHYFDPHSPYAAPGAYRDRFDAETPSPLARTIAHYDGEIAYVDSQLGLLLDAVQEQGLADRTLVVVTSDHGEGLGDHDFLLHAVYLYEEAVRIPLVMRLPEVVPPGQVIAAPVALVDVLPTILGLLGIERRHDAIHGRDLSATAMGGRPPPQDHAVFLLRRHYTASLPAGIPARGMKFAVRQGRWKFIHDDGLGIRELYDLEEDPGEQRNLHAEQPDTSLRMEEQLFHWRKRFDRLSEIPALDPGDLEALRALGYTE